MQFYSTNNPNLRVDFKEAIFKGLPEDRGLFMPVEISAMPKGFIQNLDKFSFQEIAFEVAKNLLRGSIAENDLKSIIEKSIDFPAPVVRLDAQTFILELFHGPSLAFKDFGARFMAQTMSYFNQNENKELVILVATSGDTGGAVAAGFFKTLGIKVVILYPSGKVSELQEKQLTSFGHNVSAIEIEGTFDDCQSLVKQAFLDAGISSKIRLSSANSINISRLIPQTFYYFEAFKQVFEKTKNEKIVFSVPSGNFGNLTAGLFAKRMGLPVNHFIAATNRNDIVPRYLKTGKFAPKTSVATLSNAMDVGNPSNFARMLDLYCSTWNILKNEVSGYAFSDAATRKAIREVWKCNQNYVLDPHGAIGFLAFRQHQMSSPEAVGVILETAHPAKFLPDVEKTLRRKIEIPERLAALKDSKKASVLMKPDFTEFKNWLLSNY